MKFEEEASLVGRYLGCSVAARFDAAASDSDAEPPLRRNRVALSGLNGTGLELYGRFRGGGRGRGGWRDWIPIPSAVIDVASSAVKAVTNGVKKVASAVVETVKDVVSAAGSFMTGNQLMKIGQCIANLKTAAELRAAQSYSAYSAALIAGDMSVDLHALLDARADALAFEAGRGSLRKLSAPGALSVVDSSSRMRLSSLLATMSLR